MKFKPLPRNSGLLRLLPKSCYIYFPNQVILTNCFLIEHHFRFFAASCARRTSYLLTDNRSRIAIQTAELFANSRASGYALHKAYVNAKAALLEQAKHYNTFLAPSVQQSHPTGVNEETLYGAAALHAAAAAATCCFAQQAQTPLGLAEACAKYATRALYWEQVSLGADSVLISQLIEEEEHRQAHALRIFIGNPFAPLGSLHESSFV